MKYIWAFLGFLVVIVVAIVLVVSHKPQSKKANAPKPTTLVDYADNDRSHIEYITDGPINAQENHRVVRISVGPESRTLDVLKGYDGEVLRTQTYANTPEAYRQFLEALSRAQFLSKRATKTTINGICPNGSRYQYLLLDGSKEVSSLWSATCTGGSFAGNKNLVRSLFQLQIPDYNKLTHDVNVSIGGLGV